MGNIVLLDDLTINKIAAGEVIERPASVVKEVVENSIDAGANNISIEIKNGGISYIRITDNGKGFEQDDMEIAFERHATSKIRKAEDIENITSMGFRGEALASIAAIARVELVSKTEKSNIGQKIVVEGGKIISKEEVGCPKGTTITIENLFFNTPVRYKFLKKDFTESGYIEDAVTRIALVNPDIAIKFINSGKTVIQTSGNGNIKDVIYGIYGKDTAEKIINVDYTFEDMKITGVIGKPEIARSNRAYQLFFVNKRFVKDKTLTSAAEQAFKDIVSAGKYGFLVLNIEMDPHKLDVNVHPAKLEVRFQEENKVFKLVYHAIKEALAQENVNNMGEGNKMIGENYRKGYVNETYKNEEKTNENKGFSGFFKNMLGNKNEFITNEHNVVEELYNDKIKHEYGIETNLVDDANDVEEVGSTGIDYKFNSISTTKTSDETKVFDSSLKDVPIKKESVSDDTLVNFSWTDAKIEKLQEQINELTSGRITNIDDFSIKNNDFLNKDNAKDTIAENSDKKEFDNKDIVNKENTTEDLTTKDVTSIDASSNDNIDENNKTNDLEQTQEIDTVTTMNLIAKNIEKNIAEAIAQHIEKTEELRKQEVKIADSDDDDDDDENSIQDERLLKEEIKKYNEKISADNQKNQTQDKPKTILDELKAGSNQNDTVSKESDTTKKEPDSSFEEMYEKMFGTPVLKPKEEDKKVEEPKGGYTIDDINIKDVTNISLFSDKAIFKTPVYKFIGVVFDSNIIIEYENEMYIIDQRIANERILYEKIKDNYYNDDQKDSQLMLLPDVIELSHKQMGIAKDNINLFKKAGFDVEIFGENTVKLTGVPSMCLDLDTRQLFIDTLNEINTVARTATQEIEEKFIETIASKTAERYIPALTEPEVDVLMQKLLTLKNPFVCSNGKQAAIRMSKVDIEKKFSRR